MHPVDWLATGFAPAGFAFIARARPAPAEAAAWEKLARALHEEAPIGGLGAAPETAFGTLDALTVRPGRRRRPAASTSCPGPACPTSQPSGLPLPTLPACSPTLALAPRHGAACRLSGCLCSECLCFNPVCFRSSPGPPMDPAGQGQHGAGRCAGPDVPPRAALPAVSSAQSERRESAPAGAAPRWPAAEAAAQPAAEGGGDELRGRAVRPLPRGRRPAGALPANTRAAAGRCVHAQKQHVRAPGVHRQGCLEPLNNRVKRDTSHRQVARVHTELGGLPAIPPATKSLMGRIQGHPSELGAGVA